MNDQSKNLTARAAGSRAGSAPFAAWILAAGVLCVTASHGTAAAAQSAIVQSSAPAAAAAAQYALIINGDDSFTHDKNVELALATLPHLGYAAANTFLLAPVGGGGAWRQSANGSGLRQALALLQQRMHAGDTLLVYLTGHGYRIFGRPTLALEGGGSIAAADLIHRLGELPFGKLILIADQCYSGGFAKAAVALGRNVVAVSSTDDLHEVRCEPFVRPFWMAALGVDGNSPTAVEEAFRIAAAGVRRAAVDQDATPRYAASGNCAGHENTFATDVTSTRAADLQIGGAAPRPTAAVNPGSRR
jgi:hypothetical protein